MRPASWSGNTLLISNNLPILADKEFKIIPIFEEKQGEVIPSGHRLGLWQHWTIPWPRDRHYNLHLFTMELEANGEIRMPTAYRSMYLTQPPISATDLFYRGRDRHWNCMTPFDSNGLTFTCIEQALQSALKHLCNPANAPPELGGMIRAECIVISRR